MYSLTPSLLVRLATKITITLSADLGKVSTHLFAELFRLSLFAYVAPESPPTTVKAKWNSDFRFGGKSAAASNKASHAASKSLLFSFVLDTFQAISVIFFNSRGTRSKKNIRPLDLLVRKFVIFTCNAVEFTSHFKTLYTITRHSNANVDLKYFCFL